ncbi:MAG: phosphotransferase [Desulfarculaceae bacterium]|nr:phosphotransferase [Desulfarculaceae bacterium]MCF8048739.1 phosphotransferase [Desulfarculaceae bacterium]MCF8064018.1 phosphotransferase [Desulfarculaceae bacterium]MCF8096263.1 phosphotransferase [Desulfarculaceae bacterium]MCF8123469.1 phosphotransferase [Desulfarculaceae bacterium]
MLDTIRNLGRVTELAMVLVRHGFADLVDRLGLPSSKGTGARSGGEKLAGRYSVYARLRMVAEQMGPTFVKLGQLLSQRPDLLPKEFILELSKLRDQVTPISFSDIKTQVEGSLGRPMAEVFSQFDEKCLASASLAQVHRAVRADDGREVAVKVRKPGIMRTIEADMELLMVLAKLADKELEVAAPYDLPALVGEMDRSLRQELDFSLEARHMRTAQAQLSPDSGVLIPKPHQDLTRPGLLTMELVKGDPPDKAGISREEGKQLSLDLVRLMMEEVLLQGFFHGDPHQGNLLVTRDGQGRPQLAVLDWGLAGRLSDEDRYLLCDLLMATLNRDAKAVVKAWVDMKVVPRNYDDPTLERDVAELLEMVNTQGEPVETAKLILEMMEIMRQHRLKVPMQYALADKAMLEMEGVARALDPEFRPVEAARPFVWRLYFERWRPDAVAKRLLAHLGDALHLIQNLPRRLENLVDQLENGELSLQLKHEGLVPLTKALQEGASRVTVGLIVAALIVGSSMIITTGVEPKIFGLPALGVVGYVISGVIGLWLVWSIIRSRGGHL